MFDSVSVSGIGEVLATFKVDEATQTSLANLKTDTSNGVVIPEEGLAVTLTGDLTVGFGSAAAGAVNDALFGILRSYDDGRGTAGVQISGFAAGVPATAAIARKATTLVANNAGKIASVAEAAGGAMVVKASTASDLFVDVKFK